MFTTQELMEAVAGYQPIAPATLKGWTYGIKGFEDKPVAEVDKKFVNLRRSQLNRLGYKPSYVRTLLGYCGTIWQIGYEQMEIVDCNPWRGSLKGLKRGKKKYPYQPFSFYEQCGLTEHPLFLGLWYHGFRVNELACLKPEDIILEHPYPHFSIIDNEIRGIKNEPSRREVPIHKEYFKFIENFPFNTNPRAGDYFSRYMKRRCGHSAHGIRHNIATRMRKAGIEYSIAASILGHNASGMTSDYGHILLEDKYEQLQKLR
jgi:integrase